VTISYLIFFAPPEFGRRSVRGRRTSLSQSWTPRLQSDRNPSGAFCCLPCPLRVASSASVPGALLPAPDAISRIKSGSAKPERVLSALGRWLSHSVTESLQVGWLSR